ncbi:hypothetical protein TNCV_3192671 [Trichonephila clavipes]|nr:hypothetical protein TNCV_3192671 [Trichonephila clavipes]
MLRQESRRVGEQKKCSECVKVLPLRLEMMKADFRVLITTQIQSTKGSLALHQYPRELIRFRPTERFAGLPCDQPFEITANSWAMVAPSGYRKRHYRAIESAVCCSFFHYSKTPNLFIYLSSFVQSRRKVFCG